MTTPVQTPAALSARPAVLDLIGNTPLVEVTQFDTGCCQLFLKLESQNPGGSIKDRVGLSMIETAERDGRLKPGGTVIEATAGNTGLGLALVARAKGYRVVLVVPDKMSSEKVLQLKALGAEVHTTRSDVAKGHPEYYRTWRPASRRRPAATPSTSTTRPIRWRTRRRPRRRSGNRWATASMPSSAASGRAAPSPG
jgi:cystathionine beta-synthase